ncbi:TAXI family TRAP transporter solute-binding subunit [Mesorhizobium sp. CAU 1732]|uniref:TAXI family TRAP transporter solute-binding subunit n=1 Tax=Mesorhizobium sp. CAU 1732 TaxID=3140358 RepID=UPI003260FFCA
MTNKGNLAVRLAITAGLAMAVLQSASAQPSRVTVGTGPAGTAYNQIGTAISAGIQDALGIPATARPFGGTSQYLPMLHRGEITMGINSALDSQEAYSGQGAYTQPLGEVRALTLVSRSPYSFYVRADSGLTSIADLAGQPIITEYRAIASFNQVNAAILATAGLTPDDVRGETVAGIPDATRALVEGRVVASASVLGIPALREADASISGGLRVLQLGDDEGALDAVAGFSTATMEPGQAFVGIVEPTRVPHFDVFMNVGASLPEDHAYVLAKTIHENWPAMQESMPMLRAVGQDDLAPLNFHHPYHDGAVRYFKETGLWTGEHQARQDKLLAN